ncbi:MAG: aldehyde dehydrogenase family protein [Desulfocapsaceae bacterium]|nr:aldehyde dehydrogenase family protein [Desulfocapsaceae bacterium]
MQFLKELAIDAHNYGVSTGKNWHGSKQNGELEVFSPVDGKIIASVYPASAEEYGDTVKQAATAFNVWRLTPAPQRGEVIRQIGEELRLSKNALGTLISYEMGKSLQEGLGEVQEMIDICDFAVGQSRQLYGFTMASERQEHRLYDQYHPLGVVGVITAFNFPAAVWSWNAMIGAVCGNTLVWKPSSKTPLTAIAIQKIITKVTTANDLPEGIFNIIVGSGAEVGERLLADKRIGLVSVTGSTKVGRHAAKVVAARLGKCILELGGNNAVIVTESANLQTAIPAVVFSAVGTAGQRCTTTRRVIIHDAVYDTVKEALLKAYASLRIGSPLEEKNHMGPLIDINAVKEYEQALQTLQEQSGKVIFGGNVLSGGEFLSGCYVEPVLAEVENKYEIVQQETFAPILYLIRYSGSVEEAIALQNDVTQGLSSSIFTENLREAELFLSASGSDCGLANVNMGTSGAEIGGAFGGEKETGGGRESGSDAWKAYMRRQTVTINYGTTLPLAQGIKFEI